MTVTNTGAYAATKTATALTVPLGWKVTNTGGGTVLQFGVVLLATDSLASGASVTYTVTLAASTRATTSIALPGTLSAVIDPKLSNNATTGTTSVR